MNNKFKLISGLKIQKSGILWRDLIEFERKMGWKLPHENDVHEFQRMKWRSIGVGKNKCGTIIDENGNPLLGNIFSFRPTFFPFHREIDKSLYNEFVQVKSLGEREAEYFRLIDISDVEFVWKRISSNEIL